MQEKNLYNVGKLHYIGFFFDFVYDRRIHIKLLFYSFEYKGPNL